MDLEKLAREIQAAAVEMQKKNRSEKKEAKK